MIIIPTIALKILIPINIGQYLLGISATPKSLPMYCIWDAIKIKAGIKIAK